MTFKEGRAFYKDQKQKKLVGFIIFFIFLILTLIVGILTSLIATDFILVILSGFFFLTLILGLRFKNYFNFLDNFNFLGIALFLSSSLLI